MHVALESLLPRIVSNTTFKFHVFDGKHNLLRNLEARLKGYASMLKSWKEAGIVILVDEDREDCLMLKAQLEAAAAKAGLGTLTNPVKGKVQVLNRIVVEELEAWFFGDHEAVMSAYPKVKARSFPRSALNAPDAIGGGTWEALERVLNKHGYHIGGLRKSVCAADVSAQMDVNRNNSPSYKHFRDGLIRLVDAGEK
jgi:hypothetical protein